MALPVLLSLPPCLLLLPLLLVQLWFWGRYFRPFTRRPAELPAEAPGPDDEPVSIMLCAHNELENLRELIPLLLRQDYPAGFELVLIDDRSQDDTYLYAQQLAQYYPTRFRLVTVTHTPAGFSPKKYALTLGIKSARHERLLFTDADCRPTGPDWLRLMQRGFSQKNGADMVLGFSGYAEQPGLLNQLIRYETLLTAAQYLGLAWAGQPYMGVGRNLAYTRATFQSTKGFASHIRRLSGDDDLLVQDAVAQGARVAVVADPLAQTLSVPATTWAAWWRQKRRHLSAGSRYQPADRRRLAFFMGSNALFYLLSPVLLAAATTPKNLLSLGLIWLARTLWLFAAYLPLARRLGQHLPAVAIPLLDFLYFVLYCAWGSSLLFRRPLQWK
ncbi:glycosyltransferase [Hymenobacter sp. HMF4947]|uniref:Glycosyltransferase n=1 Tax=Hymenobacter ginkgonis TaxID=2682976 RepID=A0A7K1TJU1_9BACT|nr:glycosyltransferase [Hymenobacter ginkgonis]MVN78461.1 glycosyltransferase [Hymenobacter ginkgonis]